MSFKDKIPFLQPRKITHTINGVEVTIYAIPLSIVYELKTVVRPLARSIAILTENNITDVGCQTIEFDDKRKPDKENKEDNEVKMVGQINREALSVEMAELRERQKNIAIDNLVDAITSPANQTLLGKIFLTSLRDIFEGEIKNDDIIEFMDSIDIGSTIELVEGIFKVNSGAFAPLLERVQRSIRERLIPMTQTESPIEEDKTTDEKSPREILKTHG